MYAEDETAAEEMQMPYIPHDLVTLILKRLPLESLRRFTCVCKAWHSTISIDRLRLLGKLFLLLHGDKRNHYPRRYRDTQDNPAVAFETQNPTHSGGDTVPATLEAIIPKDMSDYCPQETRRYVIPAKRGGANRY
ncbi:unnamed protein product [Alopecurus aequalis]